MYRFYNPNPEASRVGDCTVRAISRVLDQEWEKTYIDLCATGLTVHNMPTANMVWGKYLIEKGYKRQMLPDTFPHYYTVEQFAIDHPRGKYVLALNGHAVAAVDGDYYDTWDSGQEVPVYYWEEANK